MNKQNKPKTEVEKVGLAFIAKTPGKNCHGTDKLGDKEYFTGGYADTAVAAARISCHDGHKDSPRTDFEMGEVMGGVVIGIPVGR